MTDETVPYEKEIRGFTSAARRAISALERHGDAWANAAEAAGIYEAVDSEPASYRVLHVDLSDRGLLETVMGKEARKKLLGLVTGLLDAHLDLYEIATQKSEGSTIRILADCIRVPALGVLQGGYLCLVMLGPEGNAGSVPEFERLARKGESNPAYRDLHVRTAIDLLKIELETRKRPGPEKAHGQDNRAAKRKTALR